MMQIVIDIDEDDFKIIQHNVAINHPLCPLSEEAVVTKIANGTPLPKGHGRLIDYGCVVDAVDDWVNAEEYRYTNATDYLRKRVANTPTIIEADNAESEEKE